MNDQTPEYPRSDPQITVAVEPVVTEQGWVPGVAGPPRSSAAPGPCPHRIRWRDLKTTWKLLFAAIAVLVSGTLPLAFIGLFVAGGLFVAVGIAESDTLALIFAVILAAAVTPLLVGFVSYVRIWRRLHRPGLLVCVLTTVATLLMAGGAGAAAIATPDVWVIALVIPPLALVVVLWYFRAVLYPRSTCADYPWFPARVLTLLRVDPGSAVRYDEPSFRIEDCPHVVRFRDLRTRHLIVAIGFSVLYFFYQIAFGAEIIFWLQALLDASGNGRETAVMAIGGLVFLPLAIVGCFEFSARAKRLHRASTPVYVLAISGFVGSAALAVWMAATLGDPLFYWLAVPAVVPVLSATSAASALTKRSECRSNPGLPQKIVAMLKA
jgi:MFS family permease